MKKRLLQRKRQNAKDYDAEVELLASLQTDGVSMHNLQQVLRRKDIFEDKKAFQIQGKIKS